MTSSSIFAAGPLSIARAHVTTNTRRSRVIAARTGMPFSRKAAFAILSAVDDILHALTLVWLGDLGPVQVLARLGVIRDVGHGGG
jgi:hypothetical protein